MALVHTERPVVRVRLDHLLEWLHLSFRLMDIHGLVLGFRVNLYIYIDIFGYTWISWICKDSERERERERGRERARERGREGPCPQSL